MINERILKKIEKKLFKKLRKIIIMLKIRIGRRLEKQ